MPASPLTILKRSLKSGMLLLTILTVRGLCAEILKLEDAGDLLRTGQYSRCLEESRKAIEEYRYSERWRVLYLRSLLAVGQYEEALKDFEQFAQHFPRNMTILKVGHRVYQCNGQAEKARKLLERMRRYAQGVPLGYLEPSDIVALGEAFLELGAEPKTVLESFFNLTIENHPDCREAYLAAGYLALAKYDYELAGELFQTALERMSDDPDMHFGLAQAFYPSDRKIMMDALDAALHINPNHAPSLLLKAEHQIDSEDYAAAQSTLQRILAVNPHRPEAWAFLSLLAYLDNDSKTAGEFRTQALTFQPRHPQVDYLIGKKLSQKYRFAEGATYQQQALTFDAEYLPAKIQLAQDMLRLGKEAQGWQLARTSHEKDAYNVEAYNLVTLHDTMGHFRTLQSDDFIVRMTESEALVYGEMVLELLREAKSKLCDKYDLTLKGPITIELFPQQQDFAVRTFGMPGGEGFLGVCFGRVITMNSPKASRPSNWRAVLWHEFCHVITLHLTHNKMPRWLSEGISVYEESREDPTWGQHMNPAYRRMILNDQLTPIGQLSGAFLAPPTPEHLEFAYYESSLVVEYLIETYGLDKLKSILIDLGKGEPINDVIEKHTDKLDTLEKEFTQFVIGRAKGLAPDLDWEVPEDATGSNGRIPAPAEWLKKHPHSFWALTLHAQELIEQKKWEHAKQPLMTLIALYPNYVEQDNAYALLARVHRELQETDLEYAVLERLAARSADALKAYERLVQLAAQKKDFQAVVTHAGHYLGVNPMLGKMHYEEGRAYEGLGETQPAITSYERLLHLDPADPVDIHYRLARLLKDSKPTEAKKHVLLALADAPRYRAAQTLLLELAAAEKSESRLRPPQLEIRLTPAKETP